VTDSIFAISTNTHVTTVPFFGYQVSLKRIDNFLWFKKALLKIGIRTHEFGFLSFVRHNLSNFSKRKKLQ
jgi:hypothetical protein